MLGIGLAAMCAGIAWMLAFKRLGLVAIVDPFAIETWQIRRIIVGGALVGCLAAARYITYRPGRGMGIGLANFVALSVVLVVFFSMLVFLRNGGDITDFAGLAEHGQRVAATYGSAVFVTFAAFLSCELLLARL